MTTTLHLNDNQPPSHAMTLAEIKALALRIEGAVNDALGLADPSAFPCDPVNWGDVGCIDVEMSALDFDNAGFTAVVAEASPDAAALCDYIRDALQAAGFQNVGVRTEW